MTAPSTLILDCAGASLSPEEKQFFRDADPYGFILFARNCETPAQVKALVSELKDAVGRDAPVLIDQEGGKVARLKPPQFRSCPAAGTLAALGANAAEAVYLNARLMAHELISLGINVDCAPVADLLIEGAHDIIGSRAYGRDAQTVAQLAGECARGLLEGGVVPIIKHIPGHGRANVDSHHALPVVDASLAELERTDFAAFKALAHLPMAMTAHVVYAALDAQNMATTSPAAIHYIREKIGFHGLLMSDDLTMKAMTGSYPQRADAAIAAGCDVLLFCNGINKITLEEKRQMTESAPRLSASALARSEKAFAQAHRPAEFDVDEAEAELAALMRKAA